MCHMNELQFLHPNIFCTALEEAVANLLLFLNLVKCIIFSTGLTSKSLEQRISALLVNILEPKIALKSNRTPRCLPSNYKDQATVPRVFVDDEFVLEGSVSYHVSIFIYRWFLSDGMVVTRRSSDPTTRIDRGGLVVRSRPRVQRVPASKPDSTEDPPCMRPAAR
ncbi:hypothetical protein AVEN_71617-1 [Araneus ventricosus]|uniref:Uncharacterized protein n=1 Tax=Araneus ventricosus TaxID=182803 RepID=A0A4Y2GHJ5_ARAVE|nr:hypothetical protein AVEN_71617-1 [Araneus ventricosus]